MLLRTAKATAKRKQAYETCQKTYILVDICEHSGTIVLRQLYPEDIELPIECLDLLVREPE